MDLRPLTSVNLDSLDALRPEDWAPFRLAFTRYLTLPFCTPYGIFLQGELVATGTLIRFGPSAWIAQLITAQEYRRSGLGTCLLNHLIEEAGRTGVQTLNLVATSQGYPLYAAAKFRVEAEYSFFARTDPAPPEPSASQELEIFNVEDFEPISSLDRSVSGEDRKPWWKDLTTGSMVKRGNAKVDGFFLPEVGEGLVVAQNDRAGIPLLHRRIDGSPKVVVPTGHIMARRVLESRGFTETKQARRMVLGPSLVRKPYWLWSRIAGNLG